MSYDLDTAPGEWVTRQSRRRERRLWAIGAVCMLAAGLMLALAIGHRLSIAVSAVLLAAVLAGKPHADRYADTHFRLLRGALAEQRVGETLNALRENGYVVMHDVEQAREGNIDHIVSGQNGVYLIETKAHRYATPHLTKAKRQAAKLHDDLGVFVTPVICLDAPRRRPFRTQNVWVVPRAEIVQWLSDQHNRPVEFERLARFADRL